MWAVVPLKSPEVAKSRLAGALEAPERRALFFAMADRVLRTLMHTPKIDRTLVVTASEEVRDFARQLGAEVLVEPSESGMAEACRFAFANSTHRLREPVLIISGDLPLISVPEVTAVVQCARSDKSVVIVPDRRHEGTNALLCSAPDVIPLCFGQDSFARHAAEARRLGVPSTIYESNDLSLDIDDLSDLQKLRGALIGAGASIREEWQQWLVLAKNADAATQANQSRIAL